MMDEMVVWIREQVDERERVALGAINQGGRGRAGEGTWTQCDPERRPGLIGDMAGGVVTYDEGAPNEYRAAHIVLNDPDAVLREVDAQRRIIARHAPMSGGACDWCWGNDGKATWPCADVRDVASVYSGRPGYRPEWAPGDA